MVSQIRLERAEVSGSAPGAGASLIGWHLLRRTHEDLMANGGQYAELYGIQTAAYR